MIWPVAKAGTVITSYYGTRQHPIQGVTNFHLGIDIGNAYYGTPAVAALGGVVTYAGELGSYGNCVIIQHGDGISTLYGPGWTKSFNSNWSTSTARRCNNGNRFNR